MASYIIPRAYIGGLQALDYTYIQYGSIAVGTPRGVQLVVVFLTVWFLVALVVGCASQLNVTTGAGKVLRVPLFTEGLHDLVQDRFVAGGADALRDCVYTMSCGHILVERRQHRAQVIHGGFPLLGVVLSAPLTSLFLIGRLKFDQVLHELVELKSCGGSGDATFSRSSSCSFFAGLLTRGDRFRSSTTELMLDFCELVNKGTNRWAGLTFGIISCCVWREGEREREREREREKV